MKKSVRIIALAMALLMVGMLLVACGNTISGTYTKQGFVANTTLKFSGKNVTITYGETEIKGTYKIADDKITITVEASEDDTALQEIIKNVLNSVLGEQSFEKTDDGIKIGGVEYKKK